MELINITIPLEREEEKSLGEKRVNSMLTVFYYLKRNQKLT